MVDEEFARTTEKQNTDGDLQRPLFTVATREPGINKERTENRGNVKRRTKKTVGPTCGLEITAKNKIGIHINAQHPDEIVTQAKHEARREQRKKGLVVTH